MGAPPGVAILGAGSWGTALAVLLARNGQAVTLWGRDARAVARLQRERCNARYLPGIVFPAQLLVCSDLERCLDAADVVLVAVPSQAFVETVSLVARLRPELAAIAWATKGFEPGSGRFLDEIVAQALGPHSMRALLSGPTFALEVARGLPTAVTLAATDAGYAADLARRLHGPTFRVYTSSDMVGVQVGGAVKNVLAVAAGIADGLGFGANTRAALITRGLAEITRLGTALGGHPETFTGLAGLGDLLLTCTDDQSRNRRFGLALAGGADRQQAERSVAQVAEGWRNTRETMRLAARVAVDLPIVRQVERVLFEGVKPEDAVRALLARASRSEFG